METSEQSANDNSLDPEDLSDTRTEDQEITICDADSETVPTGETVEFDSQCLLQVEVNAIDDNGEGQPEDLTIIIPGDLYCYDNGEKFIILGSQNVVNQEPHDESYSPGSESIIHPLRIESGATTSDAYESREIETVEVPQGLVRGEHVFIENQNLEHGESSSVTNHEIVGYQVQVKDNIVLIPDLSILPGASVASSSSIVTPNCSSVASEETKHRKLMQLAEIAHELQSADIKTSSGSELVSDLESCKFEESVIVSQNLVDSGLTISLADPLHDSGVTVLTCETDKSVCEENELAHYESSTHSIGNASQIVYSFVSTSASRPIDNAVSVIHAVTSSYEENGSRKNVIGSVTARDISSENLVVGDMFQHTSKDIEPKCHNGSHHSFAVNEGLDTGNSELPNQDRVSQVLCLNPAKKIENHSYGDFVTLPSEENKAQYLTEPYNSNNEISDCADERMEKDSNNSVEVSSRSSNTGIESKDEHLSNNSSSHNIECSETDIDNKMDVDNEISNTEEGIPTSRTSPEKELPVSIIPSGASNSLKVADETDTLNAHHKVIETVQSVPKNVLDSNDYEDGIVASFSEDSQQSRSIVAEESCELSKGSQKYKKKSKSNTDGKNSNNFEQIPGHSSAYSEASLAEDEMENEASNTELDSSTVHDKTAAQNLTFLGALDPTINIAAGVEDSNTLEQPVEEQRSSDTCQTSESTDQSKSVCKSPITTTEKQVGINGNSGETCLEGSDNKVPSDKEMDGVTEASNMEETSVKVPKKTYLMKKRSNFNKMSEDKEKMDIPASKDVKDSDSLLHEESDKQTSSSLHDVIIEAKEVDFEDDFISDVKSRVSATYKRKRKSKPTIVQQIRTQSLRPRHSHSNESLENGPARTEEILNEIAEKEAKKDEESVYWGDYLSRTSFQTVPNNDPPASTSSKKKRACSNTEQGRLKWFKNSVKSGKQWEKLIKSSPHKVKRLGSEKRKLREKVKRQSMSLLNSKNFNLQLSKSVVKKRGRPKKVETVRVTKPTEGKNVKKCRIKFWCDRREPCPELSNSVTPDNSYILNPDYRYSCSFHCNFVSNKVNNVISHMQYCPQRNTSDIIDYSVNDMARRQRIRGEDLRDDVEPECSNAFGDSVSQDSDEDEIFIDPNKNASEGLKPKEIVWAELKKRFWPALLCELHNEIAFVYFITFPSASEGLKISVDKLVSFDDLARNKKFLEEAKSQTNSASFVKAVQMSNSYARKKLLLEEPLDAKDFFKIPENLEFVSDNEDSDASSFGDETIDIDETSQSSGCTQLVKMDSSAIKKVLEYLLNGKCDDHVAAVFCDEVPSERHQMHFRKDPRLANRLKDMSWFSPFNSDSNTQVRLFEHYLDLFKERFGDTHGEMEDVVSYIYEVWIPDAIIKAISMINGISMDEAEVVFYL